MIAAATVLYAFQFVFSKLYQREKGSSFFYSTIFGGIVCCVSVPFLLALNGWKFEFTPFSFLIALAYAADVTVCAVFGAKTLSRANMSVYSLFLMLGGMFLPFLYRLALGESFTAVKGIAIACVLAAMIFSLRKEEGKTTDRFTVICFIVIFVTNGLTGVLTYMHQRASQPIASPSGFLLLYNICRLVFSVVTAGCVYLYGRKKDAGLLEISGASEKRASGRGKSLAIALVAAAGYAAMNDHGFDGGRGRPVNYRYGRRNGAHDDKRLYFRRKTDGTKSARAGVRDRGNGSYRLITEFALIAPDAFRAFFKF